MNTIQSLGYCGMRLNSYPLTREEYNYLLPARPMCGLMLHEYETSKGARFAFIGTAGEWVDVQARLRGLAL